jgi:hypothetical protein
MSLLDPFSFPYALNDAAKLSRITCTALNGVRVRF